MLFHLFSSDADDDPPAWFELSPRPNPARKSVGRQRRHLYAEHVSPSFTPSLCAALGLRM